MHPNLERRFTELEVARGMHAIKLECFIHRFPMLFQALAEDLKLTPRELAEKMDWSPIPHNDNAIMRGEAEPSREDCYRLLMIYLVAPKPCEPPEIRRCDRCGWPLKQKTEEGCTLGNCCMRGDLQ